MEHPLTPKNDIAMRMIDLLVPYCDNTRTYTRLTWSKCFRPLKLAMNARDRTLADL
jgi:hypothetical protein